MTNQIIATDDNNLPIFINSIITYIKKIPSIVLVIGSSIFISFFYSVGYLFLYGFYFSSATSEGNFHPLFEVIRFPVPFNFYTVVMTSAFFLVLVCWILSSLLLIRKQLIYLVPVVAFSFVLHIFLSILFIGRLKMNIEDIFVTLTIWAIPFAIAYIIYFIVETSKSPLITVCSFFYTLLITAISIVLTYNYSTTEQPNEIVLHIISVILIIFAFASIPLLHWSSNKISQKYIFRFIFFLPFLSIAILLLFSSFFESSNTTITLMVTVIIISVVLASSNNKLDPYIFASQSISNNIPVSIKSNKINEDNKDKASIFTISGLVVFFLSVFLIVLSMATVIVGQIIYQAIPDSSPLKGIKQVVVVSNENLLDGNEITGKVIAFKDDIVYLVDENRNLIMVKSSEFSIKNIE